MAASIMPSASASQVRTSVRSRFGSGIRRASGERASRYSTITRESNTASPPSITRHGTLPSGFDARIASLAQTSSLDELVVELLLGHDDAHLAHVGAG